MPELPHTDSPDPFPIQSEDKRPGLSSLSPGFAEKINAFHDRVIGAKSPLIMTHDYPDPDCIASGYGVSHLLSFWGMENSVISFGGFVGRAENRAMIRYLNIRAIPFRCSLKSQGLRLLIVVDLFPGSNDVSLPAACQLMRF